MIMLSPEKHGNMVSEPVENDSTTKVSGTQESAPDGITSKQLGDDEQEVESITPTLYPSRWWILTLFSLVALTQGAIWNTWGPISQSAKIAFSWTDSTIALTSNWGPISYIVAAGPFAWVMDVKGMRWATAITAGCIAAGTGLRCITTRLPAATVLIHMGQFLNGLAGPVAMAGAPLITATWFPVDYRTTVTAIGAIFNMAGTSVPFIIGPLLVHEPSNSTSCNGSDQHVNVSVGEIVHIKKGILNFMYLEFAWSAVLFLLVLAYFPSKPPKPPSVTASISRLNFTEGAKSLIRNKKFWFFAIPFGLTRGISGAWGSVLEVNLCPKGIGQVEGGQIGVIASLTGQAAALVIAWFADIFRRKLRVYLIALFLGGTISYALFSAGHSGLFDFNRGLVYSTLTIGSIALSGGIPMFFEICCETSYPVAEGTTNSFLNWLNAAVGFVFLLIFFIPDIGTSWMNWCLTGCILASTPFLFIVHENYSRLDIDTVKKSQANSNDCDDANIVIDDDLNLVTT